MAGERAESAEEERERAVEDLEALSTRELHDRAVRHAERHLDVRFFWSLLKLIPAAEAASGDVGEALRPVFIDYLREHPDA